MKGRSRAAYVALLLLVLTLASPLFSLPAIGEEGLDPRLETCTIGGYVVDIATRDPITNLTVVAEAWDYVGNSTLTGPDGWYLLRVPAGSIIVTVQTGEGVKLAHREIEIASGDDRRIDIRVDPSDPPRSILSGRVLDRWGNGFEGATVGLYRSDPSFSETTTTGDNGSYRLEVPTGTYTLRVYADHKLRYNLTITLEWEEDLEKDIEMDYGRVEPLLTWDDIKDFLKGHWLDLVILLVILMAISVFYIISLKIISRLKKKDYRIFETKWFDPIQTLFGRLAVIGIASIIVHQLSVMSPFVDDYLWSWMTDIIIPFIGVVVVFFFSSIALLMMRSFWEHIRSREVTKDKKILPPQFVTMLDVVCRYLIIVITASLVLMLVLSAFGLQQEISDRVRSFFSDHAGELLFLVVLVVMAVLLKKFIEIFFSELGSKAKKISPTVIKMSEKGLKGMTYFIITLIFFFTILSIGGLGEIGQTFILVISMIIGLVVSFAATGSIGNLLSGLMLTSTKPFDVGDRVSIGDGIIGDVVGMGVVYTEIRDLNRRLISIPNNIVLAGPITNYSEAARKDNFAVTVDVSLGYDISPKKVRRLMKRAALSTRDVLEDPSPNIYAVEFQDHAVHYRLRAYCNRPQSMISLRSGIMENMMDVFHSQGLEILSPLHHVRREDKKPGKEDLEKRVVSGDDLEEAALQGLSMFENIEGVN